MPKGRYRRRSNGQYRAMPQIEVIPKVQVQRRTDGRYKRDRMSLTIKGDLEKEKENVVVRGTSE